MVAVTNCNKSHHESIYRKHNKESPNPLCLELSGIIKKKNGKIRIPKFARICY